MLQYAVEQWGMGRASKPDITSGGPPLTCSWYLAGLSSAEYATFAFSTSFERCSCDYKRAGQHSTPAVQFPSMCYCTVAHQSRLVTGTKIVVKVMKSLHITGRTLSPTPLDAADNLSDSTVSQILENKMSTLG